MADNEDPNLGRPSSAVYGSDLMAEMLRELGIRYLAFNPGASYRGLHDSLVNFGDSSTPEMILCTHEEIAVAIANGYGRVTGKPMATALHDVVGLQHAAMAIFNAWCDRTPMLNLGGGGPQDSTHRRSTDWVHTALVQGNVVRDYVKHDDQPFTLQAVPEAFLRAYRIATTEPQGPVYICLDSDIQEQRIEEAMVIPNSRLFRAPSPPAPNGDSLAQAVSLLVNAEWPVIVPGEVGRRPESLAPLQELAELLGSAVVDAGGPFNFPNTHPLDLTSVREEALARADVVLALDVPGLGVPLGPAVREREPLRLATKPGADIIHITMLDMERQSWVTDAMWLLPVSVPIAADAGMSLPLLVEECRRRLKDDPSASRVVEKRRDAVMGLHKKATEQIEVWRHQNWDGSPLSLARVYTEIDRLMLDRQWALVGEHGRRWRDGFTLTEAGHGIGGGRAGGVGYSLPSAIGAALGHLGDGRLCVNLQGDGDFLMTSNALWTAAHHRIPLLTVILNNHSYYNDEEHQERMAVRRDRPVENKGIGIRIEDPQPDLGGIARALGVAGFGPVDAPGELRETIEEAIQVVESGEPAVIDITTLPR